MRLHLFFVFKNKKRTLNGLSRGYGIWSKKKKWRIPQSDSNEKGAMGMKWLKPDFEFNHFTDIKPEWLIEKKVKFIVSDLTGIFLNKFEEEDEKFVEWYTSIENCGVGLIIASNESQVRVEKFVRKHKIVGFGGCQKPIPAKLKNNLINRGLNQKTSLLLGHNALKTVPCGNLLGMCTAIVKGEKNTSVFY